MSQPKSLFLVTYKDPQDGEITSLSVNSVVDSTLGLSFVSLSGFIFDNNSLVVKPKEEQLKEKLKGVNSLHISIYSIISIKELSSTSLTFEKDKSNLLVLPSTPSH